MNNAIINRWKQNLTSTCLRRCEERRAAEAVETGFPPPGETGRYDNPPRSRMLQPFTHIPRTPRAARLAKWIPASPLRLPPCEPMPVGFLTCSDVPRCELLALTGLPRVLLFKMDNEKCRLLIDLYKDHRSLWDPKHKNYHNSTRREDFAVSSYLSKLDVSQ
jgi:hypothetical protein